MYLFTLADRKLCASFAATGTDHTSSVLCGCASQKTVSGHALLLAGLICSFWHSYLVRYGAQLYTTFPVFSTPTHRRLPYSREANATVNALNLSAEITLEKRYRYGCTQVMHKNVELQKKSCGTVGNCRVEFTVFGGPV